MIAAPALLTNATCVLAMGTVNRMLRTRDRMHELFVDAQKNRAPQTAYELAQVARVERQAILLLQSLGAIYAALGAFAGATLMTLLGGTLSRMLESGVQHALVLIGILLVFLGVAGLIFGSVRLFQATQSSLASLRAEADFMRSKSG